MEVCTRSGVYRGVGCNNARTGFGFRRFLSSANWSPCNDGNIATILHVRKLSTLLKKKNRTDSEFTQLTKHSVSRNTLHHSSNIRNGLDQGRRTIDPVGTIRHARTYATYRGPGRGGLISSVWNLVPAPVRAFTVVAGTAAGFFFISVPLLIICGPPLALGLWLYTRRMKRIANELYHQRWNNLGSYHLTFEDQLDQTAKSQNPADDLFTILMNKAGGATSDAERIARDRILDAVESDEQNLAGLLNIKNQRDIDNLGLTGLEGIQQDFRGSSQGFQEKMEIRTLGLVDKAQSPPRRLANVTLVIQSDGYRNKKMRVELEVLAGYLRSSERIILDANPVGDKSSGSQSSSYAQDTIIEVDPSHYRRTK
ncbi:hypothetical protein AWJ20_3759 [Sugiyamaella lignohabitans]|uniref:Uncharacterized protein n=1 Tax=Sugiyamaella lignohabitans TaxID=796027 RepID=A0A167BXY9_9ASCO|nr:uncharacterized protein AWJ20_3759 [Sugiyamaella lignohabitans]ANB10965.1 hypothetical protein AWJ20_3759 [Sugiyamaella lignohabitans]